MKAMYESGFVWYGFLTWKIFPFIFVCLLGIPFITGFCVYVDDYNYTYSHTRLIKYFECFLKNVD